MRLWGPWTVAAGLALLAACGRGDPPSDPAKATASETPRAKADTVAPPLVVPVAYHSPDPIATATPEAAHQDAQALASYPPRDECAKLPGFPAFREAVFAAARKRDAEALAALADPQIHLDFGGGAGRDELRKRLDDPKSGLWDEIAVLAPLGCAADGTVATLPAIFSRVPEDVDPARTMLVTGSDVPLRTKPLLGAPEVRKLSWSLVTLSKTGVQPAARYSQVTAAEGSTGYVATAKLRSLLDYRLIADKSQDGEYRITALIAGD